MMVCPDGVPGARRPTTVQTYSGAGTDPGTDPGILAGYAHTVSCTVEQSAYTCIQGVIVARGLGGDTRNFSSFLPHEQSMYSRCARKDLGEHKFQTLGVHSSVNSTVPGEFSG